MLNEICKHSTPKKFYCPLCDLENQLEKKNDKLMALENMLKNISEVREVVRNSFDKEIVKMAGMGGNNFYLIDLERSIVSNSMFYWRPAKRGYTTDLKEAGIYPEAVATDIVKSDRDKRTVMVDANTVNDILGKV